MGESFWGDCHAIPMLVIPLKGLVFIVPSAVSMLWRRFTAGSGAETSAVSMLYSILLNVSMEHWSSMVKPLYICTRHVRR